VSPPADEKADKVNERTLQVLNQLGLHARAASRLVQLTNKFQSEVTLEKDGTVVNGKSIMGVLMLAAAQGSSVTVRAEGDDADEAMAAVQTLFQQGFDEGSK
jgi:phosphocarrier protein